jgi:hypothetical protein
MHGNVYHTIKVTNPKNRQSFTVETPSSSNVDSILYDAFSRDSRSGAYPFYFTSACTGSARLSSLPSHIYLNQCHFDDGWKKALNSIGYRIPKTDT